MTVRDAQSFGQGNIDVSANPLDMAIEGQGFFQVQGQDGPRYTRDGRFTTDPTGKLVTQGGLAGVFGGKR